MKKIRFPMNYFTSIFSPVKVFIRRKEFSWPQLLLIYIFLVALMMMPATFSMLQVTDKEVSKYIPDVDQLLTDDTAASFSKLKVQNGKMTVDSSEVFFRPKKASSEQVCQKKQ